MCQVVEVETEGGLGLQVVSQLVSGEGITNNIVIDGLCNAVFQIRHGIGGNIAHDEVGVLVWIRVVVTAVSLVDRHYWRHQQGVCQRIGDAALEGRRVKRDTCCRGESVLTVATDVSSGTDGQTVVDVAVYVYAKSAALIACVKQDTFLTHNVASHEIAGTVVTATDT